MYPAVAAQRRLRLIPRLSLEAGAGRRGQPAAWLHVGTTRAHAEQTRQETAAAAWGMGGGWGWLGGRGALEVVVVVVGEGGGGLGEREGKNSSLFRIPFRLKKGALFFFFFFFPFFPPLYCHKPTPPRSSLFCHSSA